MQGRDVEYYIKEGERYHKKGRYFSACEAYSRAITLSSPSAKLYCQRGKAYSQLRKYSEAIDDFSHAIEIDENMSETYSARANVYNHMGNIELAILDFKKLTELKPKRVEAWINVGILNLLMKPPKPTEASHYYFKSMLNGPNMAEHAQLKLGQCLITLSRDHFTEFFSTLEAFTLTEQIRLLEYCLNQNQQTTLGNTFTSHAEHLTLNTMRSHLHVIKIKKALMIDESRYGTHTGCLNFFNAPANMRKKSYPPLNDELHPEHMNLNNNIYPL